MQRLFKPVGMPSADAYKKMCEKSDLWPTLQAWVADPDTEESFGRYCRDIKNIRLTEFQKIYDLQNISDSGHYENLWMDITKLMREERSEITPWLKTVFWKQIAEKLEQIEDLVSLSLLKTALEGAALKPVVDALRVAFDAKPIYENEYDVIAEQKKLLKDPILTYGLSPRRFGYLAEIYPELAKEILEKPDPAYRFISAEMRAELLEQQEIESFMKIKL